MVELILSMKHVICIWLDRKWSLDVLWT